MGCFLNLGIPLEIKYIQYIPIKIKVTHNNLTKLQNPTFLFASLKNNKRTILAKIANLSAINIRYFFKVFQKDSNRLPQTKSMNLHFSWGPGELLFTTLCPPKCTRVEFTEVQVPPQGFSIGSNKPTHNWPCTHTYVFKPLVLTSY